MTEAWSLYDRMIAQVPDDVLVRQVVMGAHHCLVEAECGTGVAALHRGGARLRMGRDWAGRPLRELAACAKSWDFEVASVGVAALNAWHNQRERLGDLHARPRFLLCHGALLNVRSGRSRDGPPRGCPR